VVRTLIVAAVLALALPAAALEPGASASAPIHRAADPAPAARNPLEGHAVALRLPPGVWVVSETRASLTWPGPAEVLVDGRPAALVDLPAFETELPRRRWGAGDWIRAGGIAAGAALLGAAAGGLAVALR